MKNLMMVGLVSILSVTFAQAATTTTTVKSLSEADANKIDVSRISKVEVLGANAKAQTQIRLVTLDLGPSTDVSPRFQLFLVFNGQGEVEREARTAFDVGSYLSINSVRRISAGIYQIVGYPGEGSGEAATTKTINTTQVFLDQKRVPENEFQYFESTITVTESQPE